MRWIVVTTVGILAGLITEAGRVDSTLRAQVVNCRDCAPSLYSISPPRNSYNIGFELTAEQQHKFTATERSNIISGARYWNAAYVNTENNVNISATEATYDAATLKVFVDNTLRGTTFAATAYLADKKIGVNPDMLSDRRGSYFWKWAGGHEVGHLFGFDDVHDTDHGGCYGKSLMYFAIPSNVDWFLSGASCSDKSSVAEQNAGSGYDPCSYGCPPGYIEDCVGDQQPDPNNCNCCINYTPILIDLDGNGFRLSGVERGVEFSINAIGSIVRLGWPVSPDDAWLVLDSNHNGRVDDGSELFGNTMPLENGRFAANGYEALATLDANGDAWIDAADPAFVELLLWTDINRNGFSEAHERQLVQSAGLERIGTRYHESRRRDRWGNVYQFFGQVVTAFGTRLSIDVYPASQASSNCRRLGR